MRSLFRERPWLSQPPSCILPLLCLLALLPPPISAHASGGVSEMIAGVTIPIPPGLTKATEQEVEMVVPGFRGGQVAYQGRVEAKEVIRFYQQEMVARGWSPYASFLTGGGLLVYTKANQSVLIMVGTSNEKVTLAIMVGTRIPGKGP